MDIRRAELEAKVANLIACVDDLNTGLNTLQENMKRLYSAHEASVKLLVVALNDIKSLKGDCDD